MLKLRKESDTYLTTVCRHRWSRQIMMKVYKLLELSASTVGRNLPKSNGLSHFGVLWPHGLRESWCRPFSRIDRGYQRTIHQDRRKRIRTTNALSQIHRDIIGQSEVRKFGGHNRIIGRGTIQLHR